jgi:pyruvate dehydrogenase E2 component (dihydrolipoamide acetyltransferase)
MARSFKLPDLGEGIHEGEILAVMVSVGDEVNEDDPILEVETDKATAEIPSPFSGTVKEIMVKPGDVVNVGDVLMTFSDGAEPEEVEVEERVQKPPEPVQRVVPESPPVAGEGPVPASPATRRLARELGVDLRQVVPSGPGGLVTAEDVRNTAERGVEKVEAPEGPEKRPSEALQPVPVGAVLRPLPDFTKWGPVERIPIRSVRKATARQMTIAWSQIPHVSSQDMVDITKLEDFRNRHKQAVEDEGGKLTHTVFALKAAVTALKMYPQINATFDTPAGEIIMKHYYHVGVAVNTNDGLIVPVIRDVDRKSIRELAVELNGLVQRTRDRKVTLEELQGGTFTITNVGPMGGGFFAPIINHPEVAILGMGSARLQPVVIKMNENGQNENGHEIVPRLMMPIVLCIDHRVLDGADAIGFMKLMGSTLEDPDELFMSMI